MSMEASPRMQVLLEHRAWVQELARKLVRDPNLAEDLAQETLLAALRDEARAPRSLPRSMRAWLGTVLRNLIWERVRGDDRRHAREVRWAWGARAAHAEESPSTGELVERVSVHRDVVEAVMGLPEHYRDVLLRRYFQGETPTEISAGQGIPISTVKTRLARGHALLRERLDARYGGDGRAWMSALAPLAGLRPPSAATAPTGKTVLTGKAALVLFAGAAAVAAFLAWPRDPGEGVPEDRFAAAPAAVDGRLAGPGAAERRATLPTPARDLSFASRAAAALAVLEHGDYALRGAVYDVGGAPVAGVLVRFASDPERFGEPRSGRGAAVAISGADGRFELKPVHYSGLVQATSHELVTVFAGLVDRARSDEVVVVVAPASPLAGRVTDPEGLPLDDASVHVRLPDGIRNRHGRALESSARLRFAAVSDAGGRFALEQVPRVAGATLVVRREGYEPVEMELPEAGVRPVVALERPAAGAGVLLGRVVDAGGEPVRDARVSQGLEVTRTDRDGLFRIDAEGEARLIAVREGRAPAVFEAELDTETGEPRWPDDVVLRLAGPPRTIRGRVVDATGSGVPGARVWITDPTLFRVTEREEEGRTYGIGLRSEELRPDEAPQYVEHLLAGVRDRSWRPVEAGPDGAFEIGGLGERSYSLAAMELYTLQRAGAGPVPAGTDGVELVLDLGDIRPQLRGRVESAGGRPIAGVRVGVYREVLEVRRGGELVTLESTGRTVMSTRGDGSFEIDGLPASGEVHLGFEGESVLSAFRPLEELLAESPGALEVVLPLRMHLFVLAEGTSADRVAILDADGAELPIRLVQGGRRTVVGRARLVEGRSEVLTVSDAAVTAVLYAGETPLRRAPLDLTTGRVHEVRF